VLLGTPDIMPTLLSMMNIPVPSGVEGQDLSKAILDNTSAGPDVAHMQGMGATAAWADGSEWRGLRDREYTYGVYQRDRKEFLFNNRKDPYQLSNLADTFERCSWYQRWTEDRNIITTAKGTGQDLKALKAITDRWLPAGIGDKTVGDMPVGT
jgi:arylsulfatase A-like enzyme